MNGALVSNLPSVSAGDREAQAAAREPLGLGGLGRPSKGGHPQPTALPLPGPQPTSQCSLLSSPQCFFRLSPLPRTPPLNSAPGCLHPWDNTRSSGRKRNPGEMGKVLLPLQVGSQVPDLFQFFQAIPCKLEISRLGQRWRKTGAQGSYRRLSTLSL